MTRKKLLIQTNPYEQADFLSIISLPAVYVNNAFNSLSNSRLLKLFTLLSCPAKKGPLQRPKAPRITCGNKGAIFLLSFPSWVMMRITRKHPSRLPTKKVSGSDDMAFQSGFGRGITGWVEIGKPWATSWLLALRATAPQNGWPKLILSFNEWQGGSDAMREKSPQR